MAEAEKTPAQRFEELGREEETLEFPQFSREDAWNLGVLVSNNAAGYGVPAGVEVYQNGLLVFRRYPEGITRDHELWLRRKYRMVEYREMSSQRVQMLARQNGQTLKDWHLDENEYCYWAGGFPIRVRGTGMVGAVCVSGLPGEGDHEVITDSIRQYLSGAGK